MSAGDRPTVSVVVAAYQAEATIDACIASLRRLRYPRERLELVVVDNGSTDGTRAILEGHGSALRILDERRRGPAAARNAGIRHSQAEVIALTDADCVVDESWLAELVTPLADPAVGIAGGKILALPEASVVERFGEIIHDHESAILAWSPPYVITMNWAARREVVEELGGFDASLLRSSDVEFSYRAGRAGYELAYCAQAIVHHRNESSLTGLVHEGWLHGFHGVAVRRRHAAYVRERFRRVPRPSGRRLGARVPLRCAGAFWLGRWLGATAGRVRQAIATDDRR